MTQEILDLLQREADARKQCTPYKTLSRQTGFTEGHIANLVAKLIRGETVNVHFVRRETKRKSHKVDFNEILKEIGTT